VLLDDVDEAHAAALSAIENLQRNDGTPLEQALMVARARVAGRYTSVAETAEALGLPRIQVRQYLELADAPGFQRSVAPRVLAAGENGERRRVALSISGCPCASTISPQMWTEMWTAATDETRREKSETTSVTKKSGKRDLNPRPSPWQGDALPLSYSRTV
jgi:ParB-like chromosome segregation protein Spo0J